MKIPNIFGNTFALFGQQLISYKAMYKNCNFMLEHEWQTEKVIQHRHQVVTKFSDPDPSGPVFYYDPPTNISFGSGPPNVRDPYEVKWVQLVRNVSSLSGTYTFFCKTYIEGCSWHYLVSSY